MKSFLAQATLVVLAALTFASAALGQDVPSPLAVGYTYRAINAPGATATAAYAINNSGIIVGYTTGPKCSEITDYPPCGFIDVKGKFTYVACELENGSYFFDISNRAKSIQTAPGQVVGTYSYYGGVGGFIWEGNESCEPVGPASSVVEAWGINDSGTIVGFYQDSAGNYQGFEDKKGTFTTISCTGWNDTRVLGINDAGVMVGDVSQTTGTPRQGVLISKSGKCGTPFNYPNASSTTAYGINKSGQISGSYTDSNGSHGFVKTRSHFVPLNYPKATGTVAIHLNDAGQVAGFFALVQNGPLSGFVATPKK